MMDNIQEKKITHLLEQRIKLQDKIEFKRNSLLKDIYKFKENIKKKSSNIVNIDVIIV